MSIQLGASKSQLGQSGGPWKSDLWGAVELRPGDKVYAGHPGRGEYYTNAETIRSYATTPVEMWAALQVKTNMTYGRRTQIAEFEVMYGVCVPAGHCLSNDSYGPGGGFQYLIKDHLQLLRPTGRILDIGTAYLHV